MPHSHIARFCAGVCVYVCVSCHRYVLGFLAVNCWRGPWLLQDVYILPAGSNATDDEAAANRQHSAWISHLIGVGLLASTFHFRSVLAPPTVQANDVTPGGPDFLNIINVQWCSAGDTNHDSHGSGDDDTDVETVLNGTRVVTTVL
jgi:hypothetical protein